MSIIFSNIPILFAMGVAYGVSRKEKGISVFSSVISYIVLLAGSNVYWLFVKSGGGKSSITLRDSKLNKLFKVVEFFYPIR